MNNLKEDFLSAINSKNLVEVTFDSKEKGIISRKCIPFDFGPSRRNLSPNPDRYHFYDLESPEDNHTLSIEPFQLIKLEVLEATFDPGDYITWTPNWFYTRSWGIYS